MSPAYVAAWAPLKDGAHPVLAEVVGTRARCVVMGHPIKVVRCPARDLRRTRLSPRRVARKFLKLARGHGPSGVRHALTKGAKLILRAAADQVPS